MKDIQHYKDLIAVERGYRDWSHYSAVKEFLYAEGVDEAINEAMKRYAEDMCKEQIKLCADALDIGYEDDLHKQQILNARLATDK